jgi:hypothetical protein
MRLTNEMTFPHPVLASWRDDFRSGRFEVEIDFKEDVQDGGVELRFEGVLTSAAIGDLISAGRAMLGCFVICEATGLRRLIELGTLPASYTFAPGELLDTVLLRPIVWMLGELAGWQPGDVHPEFTGAQDLSAGDIVAMADEFAITVAQADLPALETIFDLKVAENQPEGEFEIDLKRERITILAGPQTKHLVDTLREMKGPASAAVMNSLYIPTIMTVLTAIETHGEDDFASFRWLEPFRRRCVRLEIEPSAATAFGDAQRLLEKPFLDLTQLTETDNG